MFHVLMSKKVVKRSREYQNTPPIENCTLCEKQKLKLPKLLFLGKKIKHSLFGLSNNERIYKMKLLSNSSTQHLHR